jgi:SAM-dependent methyltransferase
MAIYRTETACRACGGGDLRRILALGETPLADRLLTEAELEEADVRVPLTLVSCPGCSLVQIAETVAPEVLFGGDYPYFSSVSGTLLAHSRANATEMIERLRLGPRSLVVEIASNDGYLLKNFVEHGIPVLGIDPAPAPAAAAIRAGVPTLIRFFGRDLAHTLAAGGRTADLVIANNVLAHVADLNGVIAGIATILKPHGLAVLEMPYLVDMLDHCEFDTIYHQHLCCFSLTALDYLFRRHGLVIGDVRRLAIHGGSLRLYVSRDGTPSSAVRRLMFEEQGRGLDRPEAYAAFAGQVEVVRQRLCGMLAELKAQGRRLAAYGAAAKATTLLAYCGLGRETLDYVVDRNPYKHGRYMPGTRLPILPTSRLLKDQPDAVLLLTWNFAEEIVAQQTEYLERGGVLIAPIPELRVLGQAAAQIADKPAGPGWPRFALASAGERMP